MALAEGGAEPTVSEEDSEHRVMGCVGEQPGGGASKAGKRGAEGLQRGCRRAGEGGIVGKNKIVKRPAKFPGKSFER